MRLASFNVENMFDRAKALNGADWAEGKPALEAHKELNRLFEQSIYSAATKAKILRLLEQHGMLKQDEGPMLLLRKIRGRLIKRPRVGVAEIVANGRADWVGWVRHRICDARGNFASEMTWNQDAFFSHRSRHANLAILRSAEA
jgi:hypothetical protein